MWPRDTFRIHQEKQDNIAGERDIWNTLRFLKLKPNPLIRKWIEK